MERSPETVVTVALAQMAVFRGADVSAPTLQLFAKRIIAERCLVFDVVAACKAIEVEERAEGESAFPSLGTLLARVKEISGRRREREQAEAFQAMAERQAAARWDVPTVAMLAEREASRLALEQFRREKPAGLRVV